MSNTDSGVAEDGYISGATVFADANGNAQLDPGEVSTTTDSNGNFTLTGGTGGLVLSGGTDTGTGLPYPSLLLAPAGSAIISPLTTIIQFVSGVENVSTAQANADVVAALGLPATTDLTTLDAEGGAQAGNATATLVLADQTMSANLIVLVKAAGGTFATPAAMKFIADAYFDSNVQTANAASLTTLGVDAGLDQATAQTFAQIAAAANTLIATEVETSNNPAATVATIDAIAKVTQGQLASDLNAAATQDSNGDPSGLGFFNSFDLPQAVNNAGGSVPESVPNVVSFAGPVAGATVFLDTNGNFALDPGEASTTTDANGQYTLPNGPGQVVATGGTDTATGQPAPLLILATQTSRISPLTTILSFVSSIEGVTPDVANDHAVASLGLPTGTDLITFNPEQGAAAGNPTATLVLADQTQSANLIALVTGAKGSFGTPAASTDIANSYYNNSVHTTDATTLTTLGSEAGLDADAAQAFGQIGAAINQDIVDVVNTSTDPTVTVATIHALAAVAGQAASALRAAGTDPTALADATTNFTGANLTAAVNFVLSPVVTASATASTFAATSASGAVATFTGSATDPIDGTDPVMFVEQLPGGASQDVASGSTFAIGTHTIDAIATDSGGRSGGTVFTFTVTPPSQSGVAEDGYISGATVFADANGNGQMDPGETSTTTDAQGNFKLTGGSGPLVLTGGTDITTGLPLKGTLQAPAGSAIVSPLTTIVQIVAATQGVSAASANASVAASLGLPAGTDLTTLDAQSGAQSGNPTANSVFAAQTEAANAFSLIIAAGGSLSSPAAQAAIASTFTSSAPTLTDATALTSLATSAGVGKAAAAAIGSIASSTNALVANAATSGVSGLSTVVALAKVAQGSASTALTNAGSDPASLSAATSSFTGAALAQAAVDAGGGAAIDVNPALFGAITHDVTSAAGNIYALYETILGRAPDPTGFETFVSMRYDGTSLSAIATDLLASAEHQATFGHQSAQAYVNQVYESGLHRAPAPSELHAWEMKLSTGAVTRADIAADIARSQESHNDLAATFQAGVFVPDATDSAIARLYYELLGRMPDAGGLAGFEASAQNGTTLKSIANAILQSSEYAGLQGHTSNAQFVESLFEGAFGRHESAGGAEGYLHELNSSTSRATVAAQIAKSPEAIAHLNSSIESGFRVA